MGRIEQEELRHRVHREGEAEEQQERAWESDGAFSQARGSKEKDKRRLGERQRGVWQEADKQ